MNIRSPRPQFQMFFHKTLMEAAKGVDAAYDASLFEYYEPYHHLIDLLVRVAVNQQCLTENVVNLSSTVACEGVPLHMPYFAKLWYEIYMSEIVDRRYVDVLCAGSPFIEYLTRVLLEERGSLNNSHIHQFFCNFFNRVYQRVLHEQNGPDLFETIIDSVMHSRHQLENAIPDKDMDKIWFRINGDLRAMLLLFSVQPMKQLSPVVFDCLRYILLVSQQLQNSKRQQQKQAEALLLQQRHQHMQQNSFLTAEVDSDLRSSCSDKTADGGIPSIVEKNTECHKNEKDISNNSASKSVDSTLNTASPSSVQDIQEKDKMATDASTCPKVAYSSDYKDTVDPCAERASSHSADVMCSDRVESDDASSSRISSSMSSENEDDGNLSSPSHNFTTAAAAASVLLIPKDRPTTLDLVVKNMEALFRLLKK